MAHRWPGHKVPNKEAGLTALPGDDLLPGAGEADHQQEHRAAGHLGGPGGRARDLRVRELVRTLSTEPGSYGTENWAWVMLVTRHPSGGSGGYWDTTSNTQGTSWYYDHRLWTSARSYEIVNIERKRIQSIRARHTPDDIRQYQWNVLILFN